MPTDLYPAGDDLLYTTDQYYFKTQGDQSFNVMLMNKSNIVGLDDKNLQLPKLCNYIDFIHY